MTWEPRDNPLPRDVLASAEVREACARRDIGTIFRIARDRAGFSLNTLGRLCEMTPSRVGAYANGAMRVREQRVLERVADGLHIPGRMLGLTSRSWERPGPPKRS